MGLALQKDWVSTPVYDVELKEYVLLAYLQRVNERFGEFKLYPYLDELRTHLEDLYALKDEKRIWESILASDLVGLDTESWSLKFAKPRLRESDMLDIINEVVDLAIPRMETFWECGQELKEELLDHITITPVGLIPLNTTEGYMMLRTWNETRVYRFSMQLFLEEHDDDQYKSLTTKYINSYLNTPSNTPERLKRMLIKANPEIPNPATFLFRTDMSIPHVESFMPLAKQLAYNYIMSPVY